MATLGRGTRVQRILDSAVALFAIWTVATHLCVFFEWSVWLLLAVFATLLGIWLGLGHTVAWKRNARSCRPLEVEDYERPRGRRLPKTVFLVLLAVLLIWIAIFGMANPTVIWSLVAGMVAAAWTATRNSRRSASVHAASAPAGDREDQTDRFFWWAAIAAAVLASCVSRTNADDSFYLSVATRVADYPSEPPLLMDNLHGFGEHALLSPIYRLHSFEVLIGVLSLVSGIPALYIAHALVPAVAAFLIALACAAFARFFEPRHAKSITVVALIVACIYSNKHGFFLLQQGKHIFAMLMPLLYPVYTLRFLEHRTVRDWCLLLLSVIAGVGLSSTALFVAPISIGVATIAGAVILLGRGATPFRVLTGVPLILVVFVYPAIVVLPVLGEMSGGGLPKNVWIVSWQPEFLLKLHSLWAKAPEKSTYVFLFYIAPVFMVWIRCRNVIFARYMAVTSLLFLVFVYNPVLLQLMNKIESLSLVYRRFQWAFPMVMYVAVILSSVQHFERNRPIGRWLLVGAAVVAFYWSGPLGLDVRGWPRVLGKWPGQVMDQEFYESMRRIGSKLTPEDVVLAPHRVATWLPQLHGSPQVVLNRHNNARFVARVRGVEESEERLALIVWVGSSAKQHAQFPLDEQELPRLLRKYRVTGVVVDPGSPLRNRIIEILEREGYRPEDCGNWTAWLNR